MKESIDFIKNYVTEDDYVVCATSGGVDSMTLLYLLTIIRKSININIICAHINHNLREESKEEFEDNSYKTFNIAMNKLSFDDFNIIKPFLDKTLIEMEQTSAIDKIRLKKNLKEKQEIKGASLGLNYNLSKKIKAGSV